MMSGQSMDAPAALTAAYMHHHHHNLGGGSMAALWLVFLMYNFLKV